jgi:hypothetical protein
MKGSYHNNPSSFILEVADSGGVPPAGSGFRGATSRSVAERLGAALLINIRNECLSISFQGLSLFSNRARVALNVFSGTSPLRPLIS